MGEPWLHRGLHRIVGLSLPGATIATLTGGFLFGLFPAHSTTCWPPALGQFASFWPRAGLARPWPSVCNGGASRLQTALRENQWSALFIMRLVPALPFVLANLLPAMVGVRLSPFAVTTFIGIIPGTLVFTLVGAGLGKVFAEGERPDLG